MPTMPTPAAPIMSTKQASLQKQLDNEVQQKENGVTPGILATPSAAPSAAPSQSVIGPQESIGTPDFDGLNQTARFAVPGVAGGQVKKIIEHDINAQLTEDARITKEALWKEQLITFVVPIDQGEKIGVAREYFARNGYGFYIKKGVKVQLPTSVVEALMEYYNINAGNVGAEHFANSRADKADALL